METAGSDSLVGFGDAIGLECDVRIYEGSAGVGRHVERGHGCTVGEIPFSHECPPLFYLNSLTLCLGHLTEKFSSFSKQSASMAHG